MANSKGLFKQMQHYHRIRIHRRATRVGAFEVFEAAHVVLRRPEIDRSNIARSQ